MPRRTKASPRSSSPSELALAVAALLCWAPAARADAEVRGHLLGLEHGAPGVVQVADLPDQVAPAGARATMKQQHLRFLPQVLPVLQGTTVDFANHDSSPHNVFSPTAPDEFDVGTFGEGTRSHLFQKPGVHVILCNVHLEMVAWVLVLKNPSFAALDDDGRFALKLPPGRHRLTLWRPRTGEVTRDVEVPVEGRVELEWDPGAAPP